MRGRAALGAAADALGSAIDAAGQAINEAFPAQPTPPPRRADLRIVTLSRRAMACEWELRLPVSLERNETPAGMIALDLVERLEDQLTVYRDESELIDINRHAADEPLPVEARLFELLELAGELHDETDGAFDPTSGPLSRVWGFSRREGAMPEPHELDEALERVGWSNVVLDAAERTIQFLRDGIELNVNSIGKGYALDRAGELLAERGVDDSLMHGGTSTLIARGENPLAGVGGWEAGVGDPTDNDQRVAKLVLKNEALSTSGAGTQFFVHEGKRYGHVIDPRTGWPAEGLYSATVIAPSAAEADALSTACYLLGIEGTADLCQRRPDLRAILLAPGGEQGMAVHVYNFGDLSAFRSGLELVRH